MSADVSPAFSPAPSKKNATATARPSLEISRGHWPSTPVLWACLLLLTAAGAFLRFWRLDHQAYWTDEAYTIERIRSSFDYMLNRLTDQGFPPGWYTLLRAWRLILTPYVGAADAFQPQYLRMLPAFFGTLTVPAMYFLARQFTDRRGALLVMLLAAVNPFLIYYSRDIKMYSGLYFFVVLNMALFFQWLSTGRHWLWFPPLVLSGIAMLSMHYMAFFILILQFIFLLTRHKPRGWEIPFWTLAAAAASWIPYYWHFIYTRGQASERMAGEVDRGMDWIQMYTDMSWKTIGSLPTVHLFGYLWPVYPPDKGLHEWFLLGGEDFTQHLATRSWAWMAHWEEYCAWILLAIMVLGLAPWRRFIGKKMPRLTSESAATRGRWWWVFLWIALPIAALALTWIPPDSPWYERVWGWKHDGQKPLWEPRYLGIIAPAFLLWLGAALRRLPTLPVRILAITFITGLCTLSSLSNHLIYRNTPFNGSAAILEEYITKDDRSQTAIAVPDVKYPFPAENAATLMARHAAPGGVEDLTYVPFPQNGRPVSADPSFWPIDLDNEFAVRQWLQTAVVPNHHLKVIVLTDRYGDITDPADILSNASLEKLLGPRWQRVHEETYVWHYEWRFYIFHTWRTRVWVLNS